MTEIPNPGRGPEAMRAALTGYVRAVHQAYLEVADALPPGDRGRLPLLTTDRLTVAAIGTRYLHVLATADPFAAPTGHEVEIVDEMGPLHWRLRFFDPLLVPALDRVDETAGPRPEDVRGVLGVRTVVYHMSVPPGGGLTPHHAQHAGTGLAHSHAAASRDYASIRALADDRDLVDQMQGAEVAGLPRAVTALARELLGDSGAFRDDADAGSDQVRRAVLDRLREGS
ncbi:MAG: hypothetical protein GC156_10315 [Actinomycetales bacterium]|nr:hypothetical protein [Actinomycetales bacterium]